MPGHGPNRGRAIWLAVIAVTLAAILWGSNLVAARAVSEAVPVPVLSFWRWFATLLVLAPLLRVEGNRARLSSRSDLAGVAAVGLVGVGAFSVFLYLGAYNGPALEAGLINATTPFWIFLLTIVFSRVYPTTRQIVGLGLSAIGILILVSKGDMHILLNLQFSMANIWSLLAAISFSILSFLVPHYLVRMSPLRFTVYTGAVATVGFFLPLYMIWIGMGGAVLVDPGFGYLWPLGIVLYIALGPTLMANLLWNYGTGKIGPFWTAPFMYLAPITSTILSIAILGETLYPFDLLGFATVATGLIVSTSAKDIVARKGRGRTDAS